MKCRFVGVAPSVLMCVACGGTETGNPPASRVTFALVTSNLSIASVKGTTGTVIRSLDVSFRSMATLDCSGHERGSAGTPGRIDLVAGSNSISIPSGDYCGVRLDLAGAGGGPVFSVRGTRSDGVPFMVDDRNPASVVLASSAPFTLHSDEPLVVAFDAAVWFGGTFLQDAAPSAGQVAIDAQSNPAALSQFESQIDAALYRDPNDDGHVDGTDGPSIAAGHGTHPP